MVPQVQEMGPRLGGDTPGSGDGPTAGGVDTPGSGGEPMAAGAGC